MMKIRIKSIRKKIKISNNIITKNKIYMIDIYIIELNIFIILNLFELDELYLF